MRGQLRGHCEVEVLLTCFNDICGKFKDELVISIVGLEPKKVPIIAEIKGSPIIIMPQQLGMDYKKDWPLFNFVTQMRGVQPVRRAFKISNTGPKDVVMDWKIYDLSTVSSNPDQDFIKVRITEAHIGSSDVCMFELEGLPPAEAIDPPFNIIEKTIDLQARGEKSIQIDYFSPIDKDYNYVIVGEPRLTNQLDSYKGLQDSADQQDGRPSMGLVAVYLNATSIQPFLHFDKLKTLEGAHLVKFEKWAMSSNRREKKTICLLNSSDAIIQVSLDIAGPFRLTNVSTNSPQLKDTATTTVATTASYKLVPKSNIVIEIAFDTLNPKNLAEWPLTFNTYKQGLLSLNYSNGDSQTIDLEGHLRRPQIQLNTAGTEDIEGKETQDFGVVHIDNVKTIVIFLSNKSPLPAVWKITHVKSSNQNTTRAISAASSSTLRGSLPPVPSMTITKAQIEDNLRTDEPAVFEFQATEGTLLGPSVPVRSFPDTLALPSQKTTSNFQNLQLYPQKIYINFRPKKNVLYKSKFRISAQEGPSVDFVLRGSGSYSESVFK